jgi:hypothetical protein
MALPTLARLAPHGAMSAGSAPSPTTGALGRAKVNDTTQFNTVPRQLVRPKGAELEIKFSRDHFWNMIFKRAKIEKKIGPDLPVIYNLHLCFIKK